MNLEEAPNATCTGVAFEFPDDKEQEVRKYLAEREKDCKFVAVNLNVTPIDAIVPIYLEGKDLLRDKSLPELAARAREAKGNSGRCIDYVTDTAKSLKLRGIEDHVVTELF